MANRPESSGLVRSCQSVISTSHLRVFADIGYMSQLDDKGLIQHYTPKGADAIDPKFNYNDGMAWEVRQIFNIIPPAGR